MPGMMYFGAEEYIITAETTYIMVGGGVDQHRRVFTDGRDWPAEIEPTWAGYSIGHWIDEAGDGHYNVLEVETRAPFKGPPAFPPSALPPHPHHTTASKNPFPPPIPNPN